MMAKRTVTFEVDTEALFDILCKLNGETDRIGAHIVGAMLADPGVIDRISMAVYGVVMLKPEEQPA